MSNHDDRINAIAAPILETFPFKRLHDVTFLGVLSPKFCHLDSHPIFEVFKRSSSKVRDGTRADHSIKVAGLLEYLCSRFRAGKDFERYGVAWGLVHDIATWPLSHTSEAVFTEMFGRSHKEFRRGMVEDASWLPSNLYLKRALLEMGVDPEILIQILDKRNLPIERRLSKLHSIIHSPITPDSLEGIHRSGCALGINVPEPRSVIDAIEIHPSFEFYPEMTTVNRSLSAPVLKFWRAKAAVYERYINHQYTISYESKWAKAIRASLPRVNIEDSFHLTEEALLKMASSTTSGKSDEIVRYKQPRSYFIERSLDKKRKLTADTSIERLQVLFRSQPK